MKNRVGKFLNEKFLSAGAASRATLGSRFLLGLATALRIQRQAKRQRFLPDRTFRPLQQAGDLRRRNDILGSGLQRFDFSSEPLAPLFLGSQLSLHND